jgi:acyl-CoA dehydrogenase
MYLKDKVARDVITGKKLICLAVTEPYAGSDVANIRTTAVRDGDYFIVNGYLSPSVSLLSSSYIDGN